MRQRKRHQIGFVQLYRCNLEMIGLISLRRVRESRRVHGSRGRKGVPRARDHGGRTVNCMDHIRLAAWSGGRSLRRSGFRPYQRIAHAQCTCTERATQVVQRGSRLGMPGCEQTGLRDDRCVARDRAIEHVREHAGDGVVEAEPRHAVAGSCEQGIAVHVCTSRSCASRSIAQLRCPFILPLAVPLAVSLACSQRVVQLQHQCFGGGPVDAGVGDGYAVL